MVSESNYNHAWSFTPGVSMFVSCNSEDEIQTLFEELSSNGGQIMVPLDNYQGVGDYGFGKKLKENNMNINLNAIAITDLEQIKAIAELIPSIKEQVMAQYPQLFEPEVKHNPRARSGIMRVAERTAH